MGTGSFQPITERVGYRHPMGWLGTGSFQPMGWLGTGSFRPIARQEAGGYFSLERGAALIGRQVQRRAASECAFCEL